MVKAFSAQDGTEYSNRFRNPWPELLFEVDIVEMRAAETNDCVIAIVIVFATRAGDSQQPLLRSSSRDSSIDPLRRCDQPSMDLMFASEELEIRDEILRRDVRKRGKSIVGCLPHREDAVTARPFLDNYNPTRSKSKKKLGKK